MSQPPSEETLLGPLQPFGDNGWRDDCYRIIFEADTPSGKIFDIGLLLVILLNLLAICMETVEPWNTQYETLWVTIEWTCTILFTLEYVARIVCVKKPWYYIFSFYGLIDLLSILPAYVSMAFAVPAQSFAVLRSLRFLRVFRVMKLHWLTTESESLWQAVWQARAKIVVFISVVLVAVTIAGTLMYEIEGRRSLLAQPVAPIVPEISAADSTDANAAANPVQPANPNIDSRQFDSIPSSIYWAIVTMTTVGYGDIVPKTALGKAVSSLLILLGYSLIIVPTGFVSAEFSKESKGDATLQCPLCVSLQHQEDATFCRHCGQRLQRRQPVPEPVKKPKRK